MKLGAVSTTVIQFEFEEGLQRLEDLGIEAIEPGVAGFHSLKHGDPDELVADADAFERWTGAIESHGLEISALSLHGEPLSPNPEVAEAYDHQFRQCCRLAEKAGVSRLTLLAGLPEGAPGDSSPCWIVNPFPPQNRSIYRWQWEERVVPYWQEHGRIAEEHGCRLCFEMHPYDVVYNPASLLKLRDAVGSVIGCNFDPSHLFWQGIDPIEALRELGEAVYHVHAKDTRLNERKIRVNGVLDPTAFAVLEDRSWTFRTVGWGHDELFWRDFVSTLRLIGYEDVLSIEHEDEYLDAQEGLEQAVAFLKGIIVSKPRGPQWWDYADVGHLMHD